MNHWTFIVSTIILFAVYVGVSIATHDPLASAEPATAGAHTVDNEDSHG